MLIPENKILRHKWHAQLFFPLKKPKDWQHYKFWFQKHAKLSLFSSFGNRNSQMGSKTICNPDSQGRGHCPKDFVCQFRSQTVSVECWQIMPGTIIFLWAEIFYGHSWSPHAMKLLVNGHSMKTLVFITFLPLFSAKMHLWPPLTSILSHPFLCP